MCIVTFQLIAANPTINHTFTTKSQGSRFTDKTKSGLFFGFCYRVVRLRWLVCKSCLSVVRVCLQHVLKFCHFSPGVIPDESKAMSLLAPANAVAGMMPGGGLLPTPNPLASVSSCNQFVWEAYQNVSTVTALTAVKVLQ